MHVHGAGRKGETASLRPANDAEESSAIFTGRLRIELPLVSCFDHLSSNLALLLDGLMENFLVLSHLRARDKLV